MLRNNRVASVNTGKIDRRSNISNTRNANQRNRHRNNRGEIFFLDKTEPNTAT